MSKKFNAVGAFIYAGGFTVGMEKSFNILAHLEDGNFGVATVRRNFTELPVHTIPDDWPLEDLKKKGCDVCYANPPCAPWSSAGSRKEVTNDKIVSHLHIKRLMDELEPTIWVWESVTNAYLGENDQLSQYITGHAMEADYSVYHFLHDAKFMGLPQQRRRVFTIASKVALPFDRFVPQSPRVTVGETLDRVQDPGEIPSLSYKWQDFVPQVEQGARLRTVVMKAQGRPAPGFLIHRANENEPSRTLLGGVHVIHPTLDRFIGHKEAAALCGYPPDYEFDKAGGNYFQQIARAVTPAAGAYLGTVLQCALEENVEIEPSEWEVNFMGQNGRVANFAINNEIRRLR